MKKSFSSSVILLDRTCRELTCPGAIRDLRSALAHFRRAAILAATLALCAPLGALAQITPVRPRVTDRVNTSQLTALTGNTHPLARAQFDRGAAPADLPMNRIMLVLKRSPEQEAALQDLLVQQQTIASANFHKWLTPDQFGQQFGPADADIQAVTSWLASFGFQSIKVSRGRTVIEFSGTASQVESALHTPIHQYVVNGESHWANANEPQIPAALAPVISGVVSLHNFRAKPASARSGSKGTVTVAPGEKPQVNLQGGGHALGPADFNTIYNIGPTMTGSGATIGVIADSNINVQDVADFRTLFGMSTANLPQIILNGPDPGVVPGSPAEGEAVLDATWSSAVAPAATVDLVVSEDTNSVQGTDLSAVYIVDNNLTDVMIESFSACEAFFSGNAGFYSGLAEQAAAQGITFLVASGDGGPDSCDDPNVPPATTPASVNILASSWYTMAVGGTMFNDTASPSTYWGSPGTNGESAKSYIPENVWNESCTVVSSTCPGIGLWSSGGGQSTIFAKPPWQTGVAGIPSANSRFLPDVALTAADHDGYIVCMDASCNGSSKSFFIFSGTSASVQSFGGIMALVVQKVGRVGIANFTLYNLAHTQQTAGTSCNGSNILPSAPPAGGCTFNDITSGNTNIPGETGFAAGTGYDEATGLGSVNVTNLVNNWSTAITRGTTTTLTLNGGNPVNVTHGTAVPFAVTVAPASGTGTPTGDISLVANGIVGGGADFFTLNNGAVTSNTMFLPGGTYPLKAHYQGDGTFLGSDSAPTTITVSPEPSRTTLGIVVGLPCSLSSSVAYGSPYILSVAVSDTHSASTPCNPPEFGAPPTGGISLTDTVNNVTSPLDGGSFTLNSFGFFEDQPIQLLVGTHTIKATYVGDNSFTGSNSTITVTVTQATTMTTVAAVPTTSTAGQSVTLTATVATQSNAVANLSQEPTGFVQFFLGGANLGSPVAVVGSATSGGLAQATATTSTSTLANGANSITAKYLGDANYAASATSPAVTVNVGTSGIIVSPGCANSTIPPLTRGQSGNCLITVTGANGFSGAVTLTCGISSAPPSAPVLPTCAFGAPGTNFTPPNTLTLAAGSQSGSATLTVNTTAASTILVKPSARPHNPNWLLMSEAGAAMACLFLLGIAGRKRRGMVVLAMALCAVIFVGTSCSSNNGGGTVPTNPGTTVGTYTITVTATPSGGTSQQSPITINVQ